MLIKMIDQFRKSEILSFILRLIVGGIFVYAGVTKLYSPRDFAQIIQNYQIVPEVFTNLIAILLPWLEIYSGLFIIFGLFSRSASITLILITIIFIIALLSAYFRGLNIDCGCFSQATRVDMSKIIADVFLLLFCWHLVIYPSKILSLDRLFKRLS